MAGPEMGEEKALCWLPPGWTEEKYASATDEDWETLSDDLLELNMQRMAAQAHLNFEATKARIRAEDAANGRAPRDMLYEIETEHPLVQVIEEAGYDDFGFLLFRTDFSDDARWERFVVEWDVLLDKRLDEAGLETGLQRIAEKVFTKMVDDDCMSGMGAGNVALAFRMGFKEDDEIEPGLDTKMCLMADAECIASVLEFGASGTQPFIKAVDVSFPRGGYDDHNGTFKVAIDSLIPEFLFALREAESAAELSLFEGSIWGGRAC
ncbi:hypothetical protein VF21_02882 [Pseudogymnoascus sp. 05NY08]|nr:hypothetical protein VF21_02882 [Pseudogymnoascus sp. 05NY08]